MNHFDCARDAIPGECRITLFSESEGFTVTWLRTTKTSVANKDAPNGCRLKVRGLAAYVGVGEELTAASYRCESRLATFSVAIRESHEIGRVEFRKRLCLFGSETGVFQAFGPVAVHFVE
jgi:hypothetical protein